MSNFQEIFETSSELARQLPKLCIDASDYQSAFEDAFFGSYEEIFQKAKMGLVHTIRYTPGDIQSSYYDFWELDDIEVAGAYFSLSEHVTWTAQESRGLNISVVNTLSVGLDLLFRVTFYYDSGVTIEVWDTEYPSIFVNGGVSSSCVLDVPQSVVIKRWSVELIGVR